MPQLNWLSCAGRRTIESADWQSVSVGVDFRLSGLCTHSGYLRDWGDFGHRRCRFGSRNANGERAAQTHTVSGEQIAASRPDERAASCSGRSLALRACSKGLRRPLCAAIANFSPPLGLARTQSGNSVCKRAGQTLRWPLRRALVRARAAAHEIV